MHCGDDTDVSGEFEEPTLSSDDGIYTTESSSSSDGSFTENSEDLDYDEETKTYSVQDHPTEVWQELYDFIRHCPRETFCDMDDDKLDS